MPYMEFGGVEYTEKSWDSSSAIEGGATDTCGVIIIAQKGPINEPILVHSIDQAIAKFGTYIEEAYGMYSIKGFFQNGGRSLYINRVAHYSDITDASTLTAKKASLTLTDASGTSPTLTLTDKYDGALGNKHGIKIIDTPSVSTTITEALSANAKEVHCKVVRNFSVGDYVLITDKTEADTKEYARIVKIDAGEKVLTLENALTKDFENGSSIVTADFTVVTYYKNSANVDIVENTFEGVNMDPKSSKYIVSVLGNATSGTTLFDVEDEYLETTFPYEKNPKATTDIVYATGGNDGLEDFSDQDIIGDPASKTGLYAFDKINCMIHVWCPESASKSVLKSGYDYWENKGTGMFFGIVPNGLDPDATADFRDECGFNTSYGALYHNWAYVIDPIGIGDNPLKLIPTTGHVLGAMSKNDRTDVDEYGSAPAGEKMKLIGIDHLEFNVDRTNGGIMYGNNNRNVNPIVTLSNNGGIAVWGARTLSNDSKWRQILARRVFLYTEISIAEGTRWVAFKNKNESTYNQLERTVKKFLRGLKGLQGEKESDQFEFVTGSSINDPDDPYIISRIGLNIVGVGEFIWYEFGHKPEGVSLSEI